jgi:hypothetical protein
MPPGCCDGTEPASLGAAVLAPALARILYLLATSPTAILPLLQLRILVLCNPQPMEYLHIFPVPCRHRCRVRSPRAPMSWSGQDDERSRYPPSVEIYYDAHGRPFEPAWKWFGTALEPLWAALEAVWKWFEPIWNRFETGSESVPSLV